MRKTPILFLLFLVPIIASAQELPDTDGDGIVNSDEDINANGVLDDDETDPWNADTDNGGESDGNEIQNGRDPRDPTDDLTADPDADGLINALEAEYGSDPRNPDTDGDGAKDGIDPFPTDGSFKRDANKNGVPDEWEELTGLNEIADQTPESDPDNDGLTNEEERIAGTNPLLADSDSDGVNDTEELDNGTDPRENACLQFGSIRTPYIDTEVHWSAQYVGRLQRTENALQDRTVIAHMENADGTMFYPDQDITRYEFLAMLMLGNCVLLSNDSLDVPIRFTDVPSIEQPDEDPETRLRRQVIYTAVQHGIIEGYDDGTFKPDTTINRAEAMKILAKASNLTAPLEATNLYLVFTDVQKDDWFRPYINVGLWYEIISGHADGTMRPATNLTRAEAAKIVYLAMTVNPYINGYTLPGL